MDAQALATRLTEARTSRTAIPQLSDDVPDLDLETGYAVQRLLREGRGDLVGWKLGVTSRAKQQQVGVAAPIYGFLATDHVLDVGEPLDTSRHINPRCEPEVVFVMGRDLAGAHVSATAATALFIADPRAWSRASVARAAPAVPVPDHSGRDASTPARSQ